ncbi:MAG: MBL fold metallo-hydrolase [Thiotrichaceae bacterium]
MQITFYGVRGSIASPGANTAKYGGNTACVFVETGTETQQGALVVFDAGTGIHQLGNYLSALDDHSTRGSALDLVDKPDIHLLFSHYHWDHIQGFPFFKPIYDPQQTIHISALDLKKIEDCPVLNQMATPHFPVPKEQLRADIKVLPVNNDGKIHLDNTVISTQALNHPGGGTGYRVDTPQGSMVYITDNELEPPTTASTPQATTKDQWCEFVSEVDILIHDAMYLNSEQEAHLGWGHSTISQALELARDAKVAKLVLFHHEPERSDQELDQLLEQSREWMKQEGSKCQVHMAKEGDRYEYGL